MRKGFFLLVLLLPLSLAATETLYVQSNQAKIMSKPAFNAEQVGLLKQTQKVEVLEKTKRWYKVQHQDVTGWISKLLLSSQPPLKKASVLKGNNSSLQAKARRRASSTATAAATRGLRGGNQPQNGGTGQVNYQAVESMESVEISQEEAKMFLEERSTHQ